VGCWAIVRRSRLEERRGRRNQDDGVGKPTTLTEGRGFDEEKTGRGRVVEISTSLPHPASPLPHPGSCRLRAARLTRQNGTGNVLSSSPEFYSPPLRHMTDLQGP
jgi:hypothetical protein